MRPDRYKRTLKIPALGYRLLESIKRKMISEMRDTRDEIQAQSGGFTIVEVLIVIVIIAIAAAMVIPMAASSGDLQIRSASNMIAADLEYAKSMAISRGQNFSVVFDAATESYRIENQDGSVIAHPVKKGFDYEVNFSTDSSLDKVDIVNVAFDPGSNSTITFGYLGSPYRGAGSSTPLNNGAISLQAGGTTATVTIEPVTGFISISD